MKTGRPNKAWLFVGMTGAGKSVFCRKMLDSGRKKNVIVYMEHVNIDDEAYTDFPLVDHKKYRGGRAKFSSFNFPGRDEKEQYFAFLRWVQANFRDGTVVIADCSNYEEYKTSQPMRYLLQMKRHIGVDFALLFHQCGMFPINMLGLVNYVVLFHTTDNFERKRDSLAKIDLLLAAQKRIEARWFAHKDGDPRKYQPEIIRLA